MFAPDGQAGDEFGYNVSQSGNLLAIGTPQADPNGKSGAGAAYLYRVETNGSTTFLDKALAPDGAAEDRFGHSVSVSGDILAVGAFRVDLNGENNAGAAYLYKAETNGSLSFLGRVVAPNGKEDDFFGNSLSLSGNLLAVGADYADHGGDYQAGAVYLYRLENNGSTTASRTS